MKRKPSSRVLGTDFARLDAMTDEEIDTSEIPELSPEFFARKIVRRGLQPVAPKEQLTIREPGSDWPPGFFEQLSPVDSKTAAALDDMLSAVCDARSSDIGTKRKADRGF